MIQDRMTAMQAGAESPRPPASGTTAQASGMAPAETAPGGPRGGYAAISIGRWWQGARTGDESR